MLVVRVRFPPHALKLALKEQEGKMYDDPKDNWDWIPAALLLLVMVLLFFHSIFVFLLTFQMPSMVPR